MSIEKDIIRKELKQLIEVHKEKLEEARKKGKATSVAYHLERIAELKEQRKAL